MCTNLLLRELLSLLLDRVHDLKEVCVALLEHQVQLRIITQPTNVLRPYHALIDVVVAPRTWLFKRTALMSRTTEVCLARP